MRISLLLILLSFFANTLAAQATSVFNVPEKRFSKKILEPSPELDEKNKSFTAQQPINEDFITKSDKAINTDLSLPGEESIDLDNLIGESESFFSGVTHFWGSYNFFSNTGERPDFTEEIIPPVSFQFEQHLFSNFGLRFEVGINTWEERKVLAQSDVQQFYETFEYRHATIGLGGTWHFNLGETLDPYVGATYTYRYGRGFCDCFDEEISDFTTDFFGGVRLFVGDFIFIVAEVGTNSVGVAKLGAGFTIY